MSETPEPQPESESTAPSQSNSGLALLVVLLFLTQIGLGGFYYYNEYIKPAAPPGAATSPAEEWMEKVENWSQSYEEKLSALQQDVMQLENIVQALEHSAPVIQPEPLSDIQPQIDALQLRLKALEETPAPTAPSAAPLDNARLDKVLAMEDSIRALREDINNTERQRWQSIQLLTSFERLEHQILHYEPYAGAFAAFKLATQSIDEADIWHTLLAPYQHEGIASPESLMAQFEAAREVVLTSSDKANEDIWSQVKQNVSQLVQVRKTGANHPGDDPESILARAQHALEHEEYNVVLSELHQLPSETQPLFNDFVEELKRTREIHALLSSIRAAIQAQLEANQ